MLVADSAHDSAVIHIGFSAMLSNAQHFSTCKQQRQTFGRTILVAFCDTYSPLFEHRLLLALQDVPVLTEPGLSAPHRVSDQQPLQQLTASCRSVRCSRHTLDTIALNHGQHGGQTYKC